MTHKYYFCAMLLLIASSTFSQHRNTPAQLTAGMAMVEFIRTVGYIEPIILQVQYDSHLTPTVVIKPFFKGKKSGSTWKAEYVMVDGVLQARHFGSPHSPPAPSETARINLAKAVTLAVKRMEYLGRLRTPCVISPMRADKYYLISFDEIPLYIDGGKLMSVSFDFKRIDDPYPNSWR